jgi:hypothetical protein
MRHSLHGFAVYALAAFYRRNLAALGGAGSIGPSVAAMGMLRGTPMA